MKLRNTVTVPVILALMAQPAMAGFGGGNFGAFSLVALMAHYLRPNTQATRQAAAFASSIANIEAQETRVGAELQVAEIGARNIFRQRNEEYTVIERRVTAERAIWLVNLYGARDALVRIGRASSDSFERQALYSQILEIDNLIERGENHSIDVQMQGTMNYVNTNNQRGVHEIFDRIDREKITFQQVSQYVTFLKRFL